MPGDSPAPATPEGALKTTVGPLTTPLPLLTLPDPGSPAQQPPLPGREGTLRAALEHLSRQVSTKRDRDCFSPAPQSLPWSSELTLPGLKPVHLFQTLLANGSEFDLEWHKQNGDKDITMEKWRQPQGEQWGGHRSLSMQITAGSLGKQPYREDHRYVYVTAPGGEGTLLWHRSGRLASPPVVVPKFRVECAYFFTWVGDSMKCATKSGLCGYNGWLRGRIEGDCKKDFHKSQPRFEAFLKETVTAAQSALQSPAVGLQQPYEELLHSARKARSMRGFPARSGSAASIFESCHSFGEDLDGEAAEKQATLMPLPANVPPDPELEDLGLAVLCDLARRYGAVTDREIDEFRRALIIGLGERDPHRDHQAAGHSPQRTSPGRSLARGGSWSAMAESRGGDGDTFVDCGGTAASSPGEVTPDAADEVVVVSFCQPPAPSQEKLQRLCCGQLIDVADRLKVSTAEVQQFRRLLLRNLRSVRDRAAGPADGGGAQRSPLELPPSRPKKGSGCCSC
eukprot:TRINITY_DN19517_c0_g1_i1.p1 TRINITY_DN19517_c0_g1~~TRINITY_DN19517_c0_g1_i1.p1  ORF type:complete len:510 (+),score=128.33 TRINITY_DN19517_c0_g1_i1:104-1633(+)